MNQKFIINKNELKKLEKEIQKQLSFTVGLEEVEEMTITREKLDAFYPFASYIVDFVSKTGIKTGHYLSTKSILAGVSSYTKQYETDLNRLAEVLRYLDSLGLISAKFASNANFAYQINHTEKGVNFMSNFTPKSSVSNTIIQHGDNSIANLANDNSHINAPANLEINSRIQDYIKEYEDALPVSIGNLLREVIQAPDLEKKRSLVQKVKTKIDENVNMLSIAASFSVLYTSIMPLMV